MSLNLTERDRAMLDGAQGGATQMAMSILVRMAQVLGPRVKFLVTSSRAMTMLARQAGYLRVLESFGGQVAVDTRILASPMLPPESGHS